MTKLNSIGIAKEPKDTLVVVAMSGGVDSSTVAAMMKREGYNIIGITLKLYNDSKETSSSKQCCAGQDIMDAKRVADKLRLNIKFFIIKINLKRV
tara:strand:+ start:22 stop:306 length:285 start_codon:yes stop_codon:yes gene_type:complete